MNHTNSNLRTAYDKEKKPNSLLEKTIVNIVFSLM